MTTTEYRAPAKNVDGRAWVAEQLQAMTVDGFATIAWWQQRWWRWRQGCWRETEKSEVENWIVARLNTDFDDVIPEIVSRMLLQLRAAVAIDSELQAPCWLQPWDGAPDPKNIPNRVRFDGLIDEVRIYARALRGEEIRQLPGVP